MTNLPGKERYVTVPQEPYIIVGSKTSKNEVQEDCYPNVKNLYTKVDDIKILLDNNNSNNNTTERGQYTSFGLLSSFHQEHDPRIFHPIIGATMRSTTIPSNHSFEESQFSNSQSVRVRSTTPFSQYDERPNSTGLSMEARLNNSSPNLLEPIGILEDSEIVDPFELNDYNNMDILDGSDLDIIEAAVFDKPPTNHYLFLENNNNINDNTYSNPIKCCCCCCCVDEGIIDPFEPVPFDDVIQSIEEKAHGSSDTTTGAGSIPSSSDWELDRLGTNNTDFDIDKLCADTTELFTQRSIPTSTPMQSSHSSILNNCNDSHRSLDFQREEYNYNGSSTSFDSYDSYESTINTEVEDVSPYDETEYPLATVPLTSSESLSGVSTTTSHSSKSLYAKKAGGTTRSKRKHKRSNKRPNYEPEYKVYVEPNENDVLLGRGGKSNHHPGNQKYLEEKDNLQALYLRSSKEEKTVVSQQLVDIVKHKWGGRFVKQDVDHPHKKWYVVTNIAARKKASQALREA